MQKNYQFHILLLFLFTQQTYSQTADTVSFRLNTRLSFHTYEKSAEMLLHVPQNLIYNYLSVSLKINNDTICSWKGVPGKRIIRIPFDLNLQPADYKIFANIKTWNRNIKYIAATDLIILDYKSNEVKTDRLTGGLIVNRRPFFPFGFYCYSPVFRTLPEEEAVRGFNMMSPYQRILPELIDQRKAYMDRCAQLGMKVHYNLLSVSGGGGLGSEIEGLTSTEKRERLLKEIITFRDNPALLAWYIADEPNGNGLSPDSLKKVYRIIRENDPWHPVSVVFMVPFLSAKKFSDALDIVMADPYPVPDMPITMVGNVAGSLSKEFRGKRPLWIVPQVFGGGELWGREPTIQEIRSMTYQSIINGARGIQYFVRQGLNLYPKSTATWNECGRMAVEIAELTPWLLSDEEPIPVRSGSNNILASSAVHDGQLMIMAVNRTNSPQRAEYSISGYVSGRVRVPFENRFITVNAGYFSDQLSAFGTQVYLVNLKSRNETLKPWRDNLIRDPGFEDASSPGIPASCYAWNTGDRGATYFIDSREHVEGNHSLRLITPAENRSVRLRFSPFTVQAGRTYFISVQAKADIEQRPAGSNKLQSFEIALGDYGSERFTLSNEWQEYITNVTIPYQDSIPPKSNVILRMPSAGVAWFDLLQAIEGVDINRSINPELRLPWEEVWLRDER
jgi:hypothetical protein